MPGFEIIGEEEKKEILEVLSCGVLGRYGFDVERNGSYKVRDFEDEFANYCGVDYSLAVSSGTAALKIALVALGIGKGDEVITQGFTFVATWEAILDVGAVPVFAEIDDTFCLDPEDLIKKISPKTKAIIPVHMCGAQARIKEIVNIGNNNNIFVIEDTAQACGGRLEDGFLGTFGDVGIFSFDYVKSITTGEGGMLITNNKEVMMRASEYHDHGREYKSNTHRGKAAKYFGFNYRMNELQGALGLAQLKKLNSIIQKQQENKNRVKSILNNIDGVSFRKILYEEGDISSFVILICENTVIKENLISRFKNIGVHTLDYVDDVWHYFMGWDALRDKKQMYDNFNQLNGIDQNNYSKNSLPKSTDIMKRSLTIRIHMYMDDEIDKISCEFNYS